MSSNIRHSTRPVPMPCWLDGSKNLDGPTMATTSVDPTTAPHDCMVPGCPGPENKRKLEAFDDLRAALEELLEWEISMAGLGHPRLDKARAAIAKASPQTK